MFGLLIFSYVVMNLSEKCRNKVLGNIFEIGNVSVSDVSVRDNNVIFRLFSNGVFYQFIFVNYNCGNVCVKVASTKDIVNCLFFISNDYFSEDDCDNLLIMKIICCSSEFEIYQMLKFLL